MKAVSRFNIGDEVYVIGHDFWNKRKVFKKKISGFICCDQDSLGVNIDKSSGPLPYFGAITNYTISWHCFLSKEVAEKVCEHLNKLEKKKGKEYVSKLWG